MYYSIKQKKTLAIYDKRTNELSFSNGCTVYSPIVPAICWVLLYYISSQIHTFDQTNPKWYEAYFITVPDVFVTCSVACHLWFIYCTAWKTDLILHVFLFPFVYIDKLNIHISVYLLQRWVSTQTDLLDFIKLTSFVKAPAGLAVCF